MAIDAGDMPSIPMLRQIYREQKFGIGDRIAAHWLLLKKIPTLLRYVWTYPKQRPVEIVGRSLRQVIGRVL